MLSSDLIFRYPDELIATEPKRPSRVFMSSPEFSEISPGKLKSFLKPDDLIVVNNTKVSKRRVFTEKLGKDFEILFVKNVRENLKRWEVLCPAKQWKEKDDVTIENIKFKLIERGRPQVVESSEPLTEEFFEKFGDVPLPPYIQNARGARRSTDKDYDWYQTDWAKKLGSSAAPTASLHFTIEELSELGQVCGGVEEITLHVGLGTYLPLTSERLEDHDIHSEEVFVSKSVARKIEYTKEKGGRIWALGTTSVRALESLGKGLLKEDLKQGGYFGDTKLFITPGYEFEVVDVMMTNFHQPQSTLLAMVMAFAGKKRVKDGYAWAIERKFRLFSYGDLSVWIK